MATKRAKLCLQRREDSTSGHHCCVPQCKASARFNCVVSFHTFPKDQELQKRWVAKIRRENLHITSHTRVCSRHFLSTDLIEPTNPDGRRRLKNGTVPLLFHWNNFTFPSPEPDDSQGTKQPDADTTQKEDPLNDVHYPDHDYCPTTEPKSSSSVPVTMDTDQPSPQSSDTDCSADDSCFTSTVKPEGMSRKLGRTCAVDGCSNSSGKLQIWKQTQCEVHKPLLHDQCPCLRPYGLHRFPGSAEDQDVREKWIRNINRGDFVPNNNSTVCGIHFPEGRPTKEHPYPVLHMGYEQHGLQSSAGCLEPPTVNTPCFESEVMDVKVEVDVINVKSESDHEDKPITPASDNSSQGLSSSSSSSSSQLVDYIVPKPPIECSPLDESERETNLKPSTCDRTVQTNIEKPQDCDEYYFMSLVKMFKKLPPEKKADVRMKIERILFEAEFD